MSLISTRFDTFNVVASNDGPSIEVTDGETEDGTPVVSTVDENTPGALLGSITLSDPDQTLTAAHVSTSDGRFVVVTDDQGGLWLALAAGVSLDYESEPSIDVTLTVTDDDGFTAQTTVTITVHDINEAPDAPSITPSASNFTIEENTTQGINLGVLNSMDPEGGEVTYQVDHQSFEIEVIGSVAILKLKNGTPLDRESTEDGTITLRLTASDAAGNISDPTEVVVNVLDVNEPPTGDDSVGAVTAGSVASATGNVNAMDVDAGDALSFSVRDAAAYGTLTVNETGGWSYTLDESNDAVIALSQGVTLQDSATIEIADNKGGSTTVGVAITITGANEDPTGEDSSGTITVGDAQISGRVIASDLDAGDTLSFSLGTAPDHGRLTVSNSGTWTYRLDQTKDAVIALAGGATFEDAATIQITDSAGGTASVDVTITITGVNEAPTSEDSAHSVSAGSGAIAGNVNAVDVDRGDTLSFTVGTATEYGTLSVNASGAWAYALDNTSDAVISLAEGATLEDTATIVTTDTSGATSTAAISITIMGVNEAPSAENASGSVLRGGSPDTGSIKASDPDSGDSLSYSVSAAPDYGTLEIDGFGNWTYTLDEAHSAVTSLADDATLEDEASIRITDGGGSATTLTLSIKVYASNDAPSISVADGETSDGMRAVATVNENTPGGPLGIITMSDANQDLSPDKVSTSDARFVIKTDDAGGLYLALGQNVSLDHETEPTAEVSVIVSDDLDETASQVVTITVNDQNDAPDAPVVNPGASNFTVTENDTGGQNLADLRSRDADGDAVTFQVDHDSFEIETVGSASLLRVKDGAALDREATENGTITLSITASDPSGAVSEPTKVLITVVDVNEAPSISVTGESFDVEENTTGGLGTIMASDPEQTLDASDIILSDPRFSVRADESGALLLFLDEGLDAESQDAITLTLEVTDDGGLQAATEVTVSVLDVNEAPTLTVTDATREDGLQARSLISENESAPVGLITITDPDDALDASDITLSSTRFATETDDQGRVWLLLSEAADYETDGGTIQVTVTVTDTRGLSTALDFEVVVANVREAPSISVMDGETANGILARSTILENTTGYLGAVTVFDPEQTLGAEDITLSDDRFAVEADAFGALWLKLKEGVDADTEPSISLKLQAIDNTGLTASTEVAINIIGVNEAPILTVKDATMLDGTRARPVIKENETGALGLVVINDPEERLDASNISLSDTRFALETDVQGRIWLMLNEAADYETDGGTLSVTLSATDTQGLTSKQVDLSVRLLDVNDPPNARQQGVRVISHEAPNAVEVKDDVFATAGAVAMEIKLDLGNMFSDEDGDSLFHYRLENAPEWLDLSYQYGADGSITGTLRGMVPVGEDASLFGVRLIAIDQGGATGFALFNVIVDDGNDEITAVNLFDTDGMEINLTFVEITENDDSGVVIGRLTADDIDIVRHPHGMHTFEVASDNQDQFEVVKQGDDWVLKVKDGVALDFEADPTVRLEVIAKDGGGSSLTRIITVNVMDANDSPMVKNPPGNWWVTVDEDLDAEDVLAGGWLQFALETAGDALPLFEDLDSNDSLSYALVSGPSWLEIDADTGVLRNRAEALPMRGVYNVTVQATDEAGDRAEASFQIAVVLSDEDNADNSEPDIRSDGIDIDEDARPGAVVGTITVEDEDLDVAGIHPWGDLTIVVTATADVGDKTGVTIQSAEDFMDDDPTNDFFRLEKVSENSDSVRYNLVLSEQALKGDNAINAESYSEVDVTVTAYDGTVDLEFSKIDRSTEGADIDEFDFEIDDVNEAPALDPNELDKSHTGKLLTATDDGAYIYPVEQQQKADKDFNAHLIYLNLSKLFEDPDEDHDDRDVTFTASISDSPWLKMARHWNSDTEGFTEGAVKWEDIRDGVDEDAGTDDDVSWTSGTVPDEDDYVLILEVDRTGDDAVDGGDPGLDPTEIGQDADGLISITALDDDGASSVTEIAVTITDENLDPNDDEGFEISGVRISDTTPFEKDTITISFHQDVDPDFTGAEGGSPVVVVYQAINVEGGDGGAETVVAASVSDPLQYRVKQSDVNDAIKGRVIYYELFEGSILPSDQGNAALELNSSLVEDRQDRANITFSFSTNSEDELVVNTPDQAKWDPDGVDAATVAYTWEYSINGRGGWRVFDGDGNTNTADTSIATIPASVAGNHVRVIVSFTDSDGVSESVTSGSVKVGAIDTVDSDDIPQINAGGQKGDIPVGRVLRIDLENATSTGGSARADWLADGEPVGTGTSYLVTQDDRGKTLNVRITSFDGQGNVTSIVTTDGIDTVAAPVNTSPIVLTEKSTIDLGAAPEKEGTLVSQAVTVPMSSFFEDLEGGLTFDFDSPAEFGSDSLKDDTSLDLYHDANDRQGEGDQLLIVDEASGELHYFTTMAGGHDDDQFDGGGNLIGLKLKANDPAADNGNGASVSMHVYLRIDVAATGFQVSDAADKEPTTDAMSATDKPYDFEAAGATLRESTGQQGNQTNQPVAARIDVQDENMGDHAYGQYTFAVDDERFEVDVDEDDGSLATLRLKTGQSLDFEAIAGPVDGEGNKSILVVVTATPVSGNFDPVTLGITVQVENDQSDDPPASSKIGNNKVPGLKDNETNTNDDDTTDDDTDDDEDGGTPEPMDALASLVTILDDGMF